MSQLVDVAKLAQAEIDSLRARIAELEGLEPLIEEYGQEMYDAADFRAHSAKQAHQMAADAAHAKITAILQGGSTQPDSGFFAPTSGSSKTLP